MAHARKTLTPYANELEHGVAQGWLTGQETCIDLQDMATLTDLMYQEAAKSREVQAEICGITGGFQEVLTPLRPRGGQETILEALTPILAAHPGMWPGLALYGLRRQGASSRGDRLATSQRGGEPRATSPHSFGENFAARSSNSCPVTLLSTLPLAAAGAGAGETR